MFACQTTDPSLVIAFYAGMIQECGPFLFVRGYVKHLAAN